jgi:hypothetical protein
MTGTRIEFPCLLPKANTEHTSEVETAEVRYVYQPLEDLYILLIMNKTSNILQDVHIAPFGVGRFGFLPQCMPPHEDTAVDPELMDPQFTRERGVRWEDLKTSFYRRGWWKLAIQ